MLHRKHMGNFHQAITHLFKYLLKCFFIYNACGIWSTSCWYLICYYMMYTTEAIQRKLTHTIARVCQNVARRHCRLYFICFDIDFWVIAFPNLLNYVLKEQLLTFRLCIGLANSPFSCLPSVWFVTTAVWCFVTSLSQTTGN